jgi:hypothetical protein
MSARRLRRLTRWLIALVAAAVVGALVFGLATDASAFEITTLVVDWS